MSIIRGLSNENGSLRGLTGQGEPGLWALLGGTSAELDASDYSLGGGAGQVSAISRIARVQKDVRIANVATGGSPGSGSPGPGSPGPGPSPGPGTGIIL